MIMSCTHHYDGNAIVIENASEKDEEWFYRGEDFGLELDDLYNFVGVHGVPVGTAIQVPCTFNGLSGYVKVWCWEPVCSCCPRWAGSWYMRLCS